MKERRQTPVFYDHKQIRWKVFLATFTMSSCILGFILGLWVTDFLQKPILPTLEIDEPLFKNVSNRLFDRSNLVEPEVPTLISFEFPENNYTKDKSNKEISAFYATWDNRSFISLKQNIQYIDNLIPDWISLSDNRGSIVVSNKQRQIRLLDYLNENKHDINIYPLVNNYNSETGTFDGQMVRHVISDPLARNNLILNLHDYISFNNFEGITINFEGLTEAEYSSLTVFMKELYTRFNGSGFKVYLTLPINNESLDYKELAEVSDFIVLLAYDEHYSGSNKGPVASHSWFVQSLSTRFTQIPKEKVIVAVGNYGYDWVDETTNAEEVSFQDVMQISKDSGNKVYMSPQSLNPYIQYYDNKDQAHTVWFLDAVTAFNQISSIHQHDPAGYALYRLGSEDPSIWEVLNSENSLDVNTVKKLEDINHAYGITYAGTGPILKIETTPKKGKRTLIFDENKNLIMDQEFTEFSTPYIISKWGGNDLKKIALTFDDGPSEYTTDILAILKENNIKATFFIVGTQAELYKSTVNDIISHGHEIGSHTLTHPNIAKISKLQLEFEMDSTQKLFENTFGFKTILFRPPYNTDGVPQTEEEVKPMETISELGYFTVGIDIDPKDWDPNTTSGIIYTSTMNQLDNTPGSVILLHDGGGDRTATVEALPLIIKDLKKEGYEFVTISELIGVPSEAVMPRVTKDSFVQKSVDNFGFNTASLFFNALKYLSLFGIVLGVSRLVVILFLSILHKAHVLERNFKKQYMPSISILIPAYNEEKVIVQSIAQALKSEYSKFDVIVIDDGSSDDTYNTASYTYKSNKKVKVLTQDRGGKSSALNLGIRQSKSDLIVIQDADTLLDKNALKYLARHFSDKNIGAVAGNVKVGNKINALTKMQAVEYLTSQNLERRAFDVLDCITIVPGAISAWRREYVSALGGFGSDTLAEDAELTFRFLKEHYKIVYEEKAMCYTEAPETIRAFLKQRFRWMFGILQCLRKHGSMLFNPKYGYIGFFSLPYTFLFQIIFPLLAPLIDLYFVISIIYITMQKSFHPEMGHSLFHSAVIAYGVFLFLDFFVAFEALLLERKSDYKLLFWAMVQKIFYRQLLYFVAIKTLFTAIKGPKVNWNKLQRTARVSSYQS